MPRRSRQRRHRRWLRVSLVFGTHDCPLCDLLGLSTVDRRLTEHQGEGRPRR